MSIRITSLALHVAVLCSHGIAQTPSAQTQTSKTPLIASFDQLGQFEALFEQPKESRISVLNLGPMEGRQKWFRRGLLLPVAFLFLPVVGHQLRSGPDGRPTTGLGHIAALIGALIKDVRHNLAEPPPLKGVIESKSELLGAIKTDFLSLTNMSDKGTFPTTCNYYSGSEVHAITLPEVIKPYDTVLVELKTKQGKIHFTKGDILR